MCSLHTLILKNSLPRIPPAMALLPPVPRLSTTSSPRLAWVLLLALLPWPGVALATGGPWVALHLLVAMALLGGLGWLALAVGMGEPEETSLLLALPLGFALAATLLAVAARLDASIRLTGWTLAALGVAGLFVGRGRMVALLGRPVRYGVVLVALSVVVCGIYFAPGAWQDGITTGHGGFQWMYVDTQYHMAVAAAVKTNHGPPAMPGMAVAPLTYHFAPFAMVGTLSAMTGIHIADAAARVVRGIGLLSLLLAALAFGRVLGRRIGNPGLAGVASVAGLFFYGALSALLVTQVNSTGQNTLPAFLVSMPDLAVVHDGGWFSHLVLGHSELWGGIGIFTALALLAGRLESVERPRLALDLFIVVPALVASLNVIAGIGTVGVVVGVYALLGLHHRKAFLLSAAVLAVALAVVWVMGYVGSPSASGVAFDFGYAPKALMLWRWLFVGLGIRLVAAAWLRRWRMDPVAWALLLFVVGYLAMGFLLRDDFDQHNLYALKFLQGVLSVFAFAWLGAVWGRGKRPWRETVVSELVRWAWRLAGLLLIADVVAAALTVARGGFASGSIAAWSLKLGAAGTVATLLGCGVLLVLERKSPAWWRRASAAVLAVAAVGFLAWLPSWTAYGLNELHMQVRLSPDEVSALHWVRDHSQTDALVATNHDSVASFKTRKERSYGYRVLAERPILLEGWEYGEKYDPRFPAVRHDNDVLFHTTDADSARAVVRRYGVRFIVMAPGTDLHVAPSPGWLQLAGRFGSVKVYRCD